MLCGDALRWAVVRVALSDVLSLSGCGSSVLRKIQTGCLNVEWYLVVLLFEIGQGCGVVCCIVLWFAVVIGRIVLCCDVV